MRRFDWLFLLLLGGCAISLDPPEDAGLADLAEAPALGGCRLFAGGPLLSLSGGSHSIVLADGSSLWTFDSASMGGDGSTVTMTAPGVRLAPPFSLATCFADAPSFSPVLPSPAGIVRTALDGVTIGSDTFAFYSQAMLDPTSPLGVTPPQGTGVARWDAAAGMVQASVLAWSGDRPAYGTSVIVEDGKVYAFGCRGNGLLADCFVARVATDSATKETAYEYYAGGGTWSTNPDDAGVIFAGGTSVSVRRHGANLVAIYVEPLAKTIRMRRAPSAQGPWSESVALGACPLPANDSSAFCGATVEHTELGGGDIGAAWVSYNVYSFAPGGIDPQASWPRLTQLTLP